MEHSRKQERRISSETESANVGLFESQTTDCLKTEKQKRPSVSLSPEAAAIIHGHLPTPSLAKARFTGTRSGQQNDGEGE